MRQMLLIALAALVLTSCGVKRSLVKPEDVVAHEEERARELNEREADRREEQQRQQLLRPIQTH